MNPEKRSKTPPPLFLRLTEAERLQLEKDAVGTTLSAHIRKQLLSRSMRSSQSRRSRPETDQKVLTQTLGLLGKARIANNLNQLAREANSGALLLDEETIQKINEAYEHVVSMRAALIAALGLKEEISE